MSSDTGREAMTPEPASTNAAIWRLSWPQLLMMVASFFIGFVDVFVAGRIDSRVQASLGMINQMLFFLLVVSMAVASGGVAAISQSLGRGRPRRARRYISLSLCLGLAFGLAILTLGWPLRGPFLDLLQVPEDLREITAYFLDVYLLTLPAYSLFNIQNAALRAEKLVLYPFWAMLLVTMANTVLDFGLGLGLWGMPNLGYAGVAWATFASITGGCLYNLLVLWRRGLLAEGLIPPRRWARQALPYLVGVAWPAGAMQLLWHSGYLVLFAIIASLPHEAITALAGMTAGIRIESLLFLPGFAFNMTASIMVGHELGAGRKTEAKRLAVRLLFIGGGIMSVLAVVLWQVLTPLAAFLAPEPQVTAEAVNYLRFNLVGIPFTMINMILGGTFIGAGASRFNLLSFASSAWLIRLPLAYLLGHVILGTATGVWMAMLASMGIQACLMLYLFLKRDWAGFAMHKIKRTERSQTCRLPSSP